MAKARPSLKFRFRANSQNKELVRESINSLAENFANVLVNQVVIAASDATFAAAKARLTRRIEAAVNREIAQLSFMVSKFLVQPDKNGATGPRGTISAFDKNTSDTFSQQGIRWNYGQYDLTDSGVSWRERTYQYIMWKSKNDKPMDWWLLTGDLKEALSKSQFYTRNFGPVQVQFIRSPSSSGTARLTSTGAGRPTKTLRVGTISVSALGRISADMLPSLASGDPKGGSTPSGENYLTSLIGDSDVRNKLRGRGEYRPVLEPFLSYFLTRAIPNSVFRVTEQLITDVSIRDDITKTVGTAGRGSTGLNF